MTVSLEDAKIHIKELHFNNPTVLGFELLEGLNPKTIEEVKKQCDEFFNQSGYELLKE